jgi:hypothetical protein
MAHYIDELPELWKSLGTTKSQVSKALARAVNAGLFQSLGEALASLHCALRTKNVSRCGIHVINSYLFVDSHHNMPLPVDTNLAASHESPSTVSSTEYWAEVMSPESRRGIPPVIVLECGPHTVVLQGLSKIRAMQMLQHQNMKIDVITLTGGHYPPVAHDERAHYPNSGPTHAGHTYDGADDNALIRAFEHNYPGAWGDKKWPDSRIRWALFKDTEPSLAHIDGKSICDRFRKLWKRHLAE